MVSVPAKCVNIGPVKTVMLVSTTNHDRRSKSWTACVTDRYIHIETEEARRVVLSIPGCGTPNRAQVGPKMAPIAPDGAKVD